MQALLVGAVNAAGRAVDCLTSAVEAAWPRSAVNGEVERLTADGWDQGTYCDFGFVLALHRDDPDSTLRAVRAAGFDVDEDAHPTPGYATVRTLVPLRAWHLSYTLARLNRAARRCGGFAEMLGPASAAVRVGGLSESVSGGALRTNP